METGTSPGEALLSIIFFQMAPKVVCDTVLSLVREGFLQQVLGSALLQVDSLIQ